MTLKLPVLQTFKLSSDYCGQNLKTIIPFIGSNCLALLALDYAGGWKSPVFLAVLLFLYILWSIFFRVYFNKKPLFLAKSFTDSLAPSTKILLIMFAFGTVLVFLPYILVMLGLPVNFLEKYMDNSHTVDICLNLLFLAVAPQIFYRPYFAWISSTIGRNKSLRFAFDKTKNNYWQLFTITFFINVLMLAVALWVSNIFIQYLLASIIFTYFNVVLAKSYDFFFKI